MVTAVVATDGESSTSSSRQCQGADRKRQRAREHGRPRARALDHPSRRQRHQRHEDADRRREPAGQHEGKAELGAIPSDQRGNLAELRAGHHPRDEQDDDRGEPAKSVRHVCPSNETAGPKAGGSIPKKVPPLSTGRRCPTCSRAP
jgi:hypothetical protein